MQVFVIAVALLGAGDSEDLPPVIEVPTTVKVRKVVPSTPQVVTKKRTVTVPRTVYDEVELQEEHLVVPPPQVVEEEVETTVPYVRARPRLLVPLFSGPYLLGPRSYKYQMRVRDGGFRYRERYSY